MAVLKCKSCGAPLTVTEGSQIVECGYCALQQTIPRVDDEFKLQMFNQANDLRRRFDFDGAKSFLQAVIAQHPTEAEAYWQICLCKYGIMYVEDQTTLKQIPTFYRMIPQSILADEDYLKACEHAGAADWKYQEEAQKIEKLQKKILELTQNEDPYDIFICYKKTDLDTGAQTEDSKIASQIYMKLIENGYRVFWAERSLPPGCEYEPYIYSALATAKIMLILSTDQRHFDAPWVKNEWVRFLDMMGRDGNKTIMTCYKNIAAEQIPSALKSLQALNMGDMLFSSDLIDRIERKLPKKKNDLDTESLYAAFKNFQATTQTQVPVSAGEVTTKELALDNGVYVGGAIAGKPHGFGTYHLANGERYEGNWHVGKHQGQGTYYYKNGSSWSGEWNDNLPLNGSGIFHFTTKNNKRLSWEGTLQNGRLYGQGVIRVNDLVEQEGNFKDGKLNGQGVYHISPKTTCSGEFRQGTPYNAQGTYYYNDNKDLLFTGNWVEGKPNGEGFFEIPAKKQKIHGFFEKGFTGQCHWDYADGSYYEGAVVDGQYHGQGQKVSKEGNLVYVGNYEKNKPNGYGVYYAKHFRYEGEFVNSEFHGQGTLTYPEGSWTGEWKENKRWKGQGLILYLDKNGEPTGRFYNGYLVNGQAAGRGVFRHEDGSRFDGEFFQDSYYNGYLYDANNNLIDTYYNGQSRNQRRAQTNKIIADTAYTILKHL